MDVSNLAAGTRALPPDFEVINVNLHLRAEEYCALMREAREEGISLSEKLRLDWQTQGSGFQNPVYEHSPSKRTGKDSISVVSWVNKPELYQQLVLGSMHPNAGFQKYSGEVHFIEVPPHMGFKNIGEAYEEGRRVAVDKHGSGIVIYVHQDAYPVDWMYLEKVYQAHRAGISATGVIGCIEPTGGAWFHGRDPGKMSGFIDMGTGRIIGYDDRPVEVVDALVFSCRSDIPWSTDYEGPHMAVEDMCMRVKEAGGEIWNISTQFMHLSPGSTDESFWRSVETFRRVWAHRLPKNLESVEALRERTRKEREMLGLDMEGNLTPEGKEELDRMKAEASALVERNRKAQTPAESARRERDRIVAIEDVRRKLEAQKGKKR